MNRAGLECINVVLVLKSCEQKLTHKKLQQILTVEELQRGDINFITKNLIITENGHEQERKRFLTKSKGCSDEDAMPLVHNVNKQEDNIEQ